MGMNLEFFSKQIKEAISRAAELKKRAAGQPAMHPFVVGQTLEDLQVTLEELRVAEEELRAQSDQLAKTSEMVHAERSRYEELFEFAPDGYFVTDKEGVIVEANRAAADMVGRQKRFILAQPLVNYIAPEHRNCFHTELTRMNESDSSDATFEALFRPQIGRPFYASLKVGAVRNRKGRLTGLRWIVRDISERKEAEEEIRELNAQLESLLNERTAQLERATREVARLKMQTEPQPRLPLENAVLARLHKQAYDEILPHLEEIDLPLSKVLYRPDDPIDYVYFPTAGMISLVSGTEEGGSIEVGMVGKDGMIGLPFFLGARRSPFLITVQISGKALKMKADQFKVKSAQQPSLHNIMLRYAYIMFTQLTQSVVCNRFHSIEERFCRWLLMAQDCSQADSFHLTQEFISQMLGVRRSGVTVAAGTLQDKGLIKFTRGHITILDRAGLKSNSCECYRIVRDETEHLMGV